MNFSSYRIRSALCFVLAWTLWRTAVAGADQAMVAAGPSALTYSDGTWIHFPAIAQPDPNESGAACFDAPRSRMILFGGYSKLTGLAYTLWSLSLTGQPKWAPLVTQGTPPSARYAHSMIYDPVRDRLLVFGGTTDGVQALNDLWELQLSGVPTWHKLAVENSAAGRFAHTAVYDPVGDRMIMFGGYRATFLNETWQLSLSGVPRWSQLPTPGYVPSPRDFTSAIYDAANHRMVIFGGNTGAGGNSTPLADTWALDLGGEPTWTQLATGGVTPAPRLGHACFYDPIRRRMILMGGRNITTRMNDLHALALDGSNVWSTLNPTGILPSPRSGETFVYDGAADRAVLFSGNVDTEALADGWTLALEGTLAWSKFPPHPDPRLGHQSIYDSARGRLVLFGGTALLSPGQPNVNDTWALPLDGGNYWTALDQSAATKPAERANHVLVADSAHDRMLLFGGNNYNTFFNDLWSFDLSTQTWTTIPASSPPPPRATMASVFDALRSRQIVFGGWNGFHALNETWELNLQPSASWAPMVMTGSLPFARYGHTMVYDRLRDRVLVYGGFDGRTRFADVWALNLSGVPAWTQVATTGTAPSPRYGHNAMYDPLRDRMIVFGGYDGAFLNSAFALDLSSMPAMWSQLHPSGIPPTARDFASGSYDAGSDRFVIVGGNGPPTPPGGDTWGLTWDGIPTPTLLSLIDYEVQPGHVTLRWEAADAAGIQAGVERSADGASWDLLGSPRLEGTNLLLYDDLAVPPGRYSYRLRYSSGLGERLSELVWVDVPAEVKLALRGFRPNPALNAAAISFSLPDTRRAILQVHDVRGRIVFSREVGGLGPGIHIVRLDSGEKLASGIYWIRLERPEGPLTAKGIVVR